MSRLIAGVIATAAIFFALAHRSPTVVVDSSRSAPDRTSDSQVITTTTAAPTTTAPTTTFPPADPVLGVGQLPGTEWEMIFREEFEGDSINSDIWTACYWWDNNGCSNEGNNELQWYLPEQRLLEDGALHLRAEEGEVNASNGETYPYRSGMVTSGRPTDDGGEPGFAFTYGYLEARVRMPVGQGLWPAVWMMPITHESKPEIDVVEVLGHRPETYELHFHTLDDNDERISFGSEFTDADLADGWHLVGVNWTPDGVSWMIDGVEQWSIDEYVPDEPLYLLFNLAVGGDWPGSPDDSTVFPADFEIDYVRVWQEVS